MTNLKPNEQFRTFRMQWPRNHDLNVVISISSLGNYDTRWEAAVLSMSSISKWFLWLKWAPSRCWSWKTGWIPWCGWYLLALRLHVNCSRLWQKQNIIRSQRNQTLGKRAQVGSSSGLITTTDVLWSSRCKQQVSKRISSFCNNFQNECLMVLPLCFSLYLKPNNLS